MFLSKFQVLKTIFHNRFDQICHQHLNYFSKNSIKICERVGFVLLKYMNMMIFILGQSGGIEKKNLKIICKTLPNNKKIITNNYLKYLNHI